MIGRRTRGSMTGAFFGVLFDGFAYGMLLFLLSVGLSVTLGMMNFVNLAHCSFAMLGGYATVTLMNGSAGRSWPRCQLAFVIAAVVSVAVERTLFQRLYQATELSQCLLTIGVVFISVAGAAYIYGTVQQPVRAARLTCAAPCRDGREPRRLSPVPDRSRIGDHRRSSSPRSNIPGSARRCVRPSTTSAWRAAWVSTSTPHSPSRLRSAAVSPASVAHWPSRSSASTLRSR